MTSLGTVPFTTAWLAPREEQYALEALRSGQTSGDGVFTRRATDLLRPLVGGGESLLTTSCTHALEMSALLLRLEPGDEVIIPSFTFVSTANAFAIHGATPVFVDIRPDTFNIDTDAVEAAITPRTRAIVVVHYGGVACDMARIAELAAQHGLVVIEDNAHGLGGALDGQALGSFGAMATQSFHSTKNVSCGEGGALVLNDPAFVERAEIIREKGTNRSQFYRGMVDKYRWMDLGSSYLPSDVLAALLAAQLESFDGIQGRRREIWDSYAKELASWAWENGVSYQAIPEGVEHPSHVFAVLMPSHADRSRLIESLGRKGIVAPFHYVPLHNSPFGVEVGRTSSDGCPVTIDVSDRLIRFPLYTGLESSDLERVIDAITRFAA